MPELVQETAPAVAQPHPEQPINEALLKCVHTLHSGADPDTAIHELLEIIAHFYHANRAYIFEYDRKAWTTSNTYEWCAEGVSPEIDNLQDVPLSEVQRWEDLFNTEGIVCIGMLGSEVDPESAEYQILAAQGIESLLVAPIELGGERIGFIGVDDPRRSSAETALLQTIAAFIADDIDKRGILKRLQQALSSAQAETAEEQLKRERLKELLDSCSAGIVTGYFRGMAGQFTSANRYFCDLLGLSEDEITGRSESGDLSDGRTRPGLLEAIVPEDLPKVMTYFGGLLEGEGREEAEVFRLRTVTVPEGQYLNCLSRTVRQADGTYTIYSVYTDATGQQQQKHEFDRLLQDLLVTNPHSRCAYHLNLTQNLCSDCHGADEFVRHILDCSTVDELLRRVSELVLDADVKKEFETNCTRERLIERQAAGESKFALVYRRRTEKKKYLWVETYYHLLRNPTTGDIEAIAYTIDVDHDKIEDMIISQIAEKEFYAYGTVDVETHRVEHYYLDGHQVDESGTNMTVESDLGRMCRRMNSEEEAEAFSAHTDTAAICRQLENAESVSFDFGMDQRRMQISYRYLDERKDLLAFTISDITELVARQEETMRILREALNAANGANTAKTEFLSRMSHDIRTPMNAIIGFATLLHSNPDDPERVKDQAGKILASGQHLLRLINDVLDMSKIESGRAQLSIDTFSLRSLISDTEGIIRPQTQARGQQLSIDFGEVHFDTFTGDESKLQQILLNILSNAVKYTQPGGHITLRIRGEMDKTGLQEAVSFEIEDNGRGMSEEFRQEIFEPFSREQLENQEAAQGTGLGMAITRSLVQMMGGTISVRSRLGEGSTFTVMVPLSVVRETDAVEKEAAAAEEEFRMDGLRILAAEDNALNAEILTEVMKMEGASVHVEPDGKAVTQAFREAAPGAYDLILMDVQMPVMNGYEAARAIRAMASDASIPEEKRAESRQIPILAMTANAFTDDVRSALDAGMNAHVAKPLDVGVLKKTLAELDVHAAE